MPASRAGNVPFQTRRRPSAGYCGHDMDANGSPPPGRLPSYRAILVVDAKGFSKNASAQQPELSIGVVQVLESAFMAGGLAEVWSDRRFRQQAHTRDGCTVGLP